LLNFYIILCNGYVTNKKFMSQGIIRGLSTYYADGLERMKIWDKKSLASSLPLQIKTRIPIILTIGTETYEAGLRATKNTPYVWICQDLKDSRGKKTSLARVLMMPWMTKMRMRKPSSIDLLACSVYAHLYPHPLSSTVSRKTGLALAEGAGHETKEFPTP
jgi:hypothetical protein